MERRAISVRGIVQGVGFRPFIFDLAHRLQLCGFVKNSTAGVLIEIEGEPAALDRFLAALAQPPPLASVAEVYWQPCQPRGEKLFRIEPSSTGTDGPVIIAPDWATCDHCLAELFDPGNRRHGYPFINCTNCGPRLTIVTGAPYDRERTTMAEFVMCTACRAEYEDPGNRRFHAQANACAECGPCLQALDSAGTVLPDQDPLNRFARMLRAAGIGAVKGLGGFHLCCLALDADAVQTLRRRKQRDEKPFAIMVRDLAAAQECCHVSSAEAALLQCNRRPIVLLRKRSEMKVAPSVAPGNPYLGVMLPYTPLHHLLMHAVGEAPLVMTSGNRADEPIACDNADAVARLRGIADLFLVHNRPIHVRCDDTVTRIMGRYEQPVRRSRGYAPEPIRLPRSCPVPTLAVGGQFKATFALGRDNLAFVSHHLGDLDELSAYRAFERDLELYQQLFGATPQLLAHDLHPDYASTRYARSSGLPCLAVQHHHAHLASCMAENGLTGPAIGVTLDGTGYGTDGTIWGGEFLIGDDRQFQRAAHLRAVGMPGGERAIREPWRMALAHLLDSETKCRPFLERLPASAVRTVQQMLDRRFNTPLTSSAGRLFDAVAALAGVRDTVSYEGQAAQQLEWLASDAPPDGVYPFDLTHPNAAWVVDTRPIIRAVAQDAERGASPATIARRFHSTLVDLIVAVCRQLRQQSGLQEVVLSGGVFMNALLTQEVTERLASEGYRVHRHRKVPPNDGGLALGQLAIAIASQAT